MPCTTILVGKKASYDGSTIIARNDDGSFHTKQMKIMKANQPSKYKCVISHLTIELPKKSYRYSYLPNLDKSEGIWGACGINEKNVSMTATETITSNPLVMGADPLVKYERDSKKRVAEGGIGEEDLVSIILPYISSERQGVERLGQLLEKYGTYEMNGLAFADENEIWWVETIGGHNFVAVKVPDDRVVIMPNCFGLDYFDINDAYSKQVNNICSKGLKKLIKDNFLDITTDKKFNPRVIFGSHSDQDHLYNTPRSWYMLKYFCPTKYDWNNNPPYTPTSDNIPFSLVPEKKVTIQDIKYVLSSHYQATEFDPYCKSERAGAYRCIGVPNSDDSGILQIRPYMPKELKGVEWMSFGGSGFTACIPQYTNVDDFPSYVSKTPKDVTSNYFYWDSRIIASLIDAHYQKAVIFDERYQNRVFNESYRILNEYDKKMMKTKDYSLCKEANEEICKMLSKNSKQILHELLDLSGQEMKTRFHRNDN